MSIPKFDPKEIEGIPEAPATPFGPGIKQFRTPVTPKEAVKGAMTGKAYWQVVSMLVEHTIFTPKLLPDNVARAFVFEAQPFNALQEGGGKDMFGIEWEYIPVATGSMVRPGKPFVEDANEIMAKLKWPDIDSWDWEGSAKANNDTYLKTDKFNLCWFQTGWYERLISLMDFEGAIMALIDEDQQGAVHTFFDKLSDLYIRIFDKFITYFPGIDGFYIHDDWGSQKETFFSPAVAAEMIVPYMKRVTDFIHSKGKLCELHSCGQLLKQVPNMIAAGWDAWAGQTMNDTAKIYELYGDKILVGVMPEMYDPSTKTEEEQRAAAREFANKFCHPDKPSYLNYNGLSIMTPAYREELYKQSRINYSK
jgi:hypothetical protein